ncbi:hypothetical protein DAPPUDRAFT_245641 [Daphnia pulex]|uniref:Uncharacterized protein n=1 Tax=Daphnia pulex TaxID=6669 RepID=E9GNR4_DAPPU|nr:hypothetical protein DAPPUDRAFT_245641 [Daphnia pulex]|eukprot:EFX78908.1 hypothetical protein DAPPUDRAFT_245641 [Daphnia pulex]
MAAAKDVTPRTSRRRHAMTSPPTSRHQTTRTQQLPSQHSSRPDWPSLTLGPAGVTTQTDQEDSPDRPKDKLTRRPC